MDDVSNTLGGRLDTTCALLDHRIDELGLACERRHNDEMNVVQQEQNHRHVLERDVARMKVHMEKDLERPLDGIIAQLTQRYGGNVDDTGAVEITASSDAASFIFKKGPKIVANFDDGTIFSTKNLSGSWICYHFQRGISVIVTSYSIASCCYQGDGSPKSWVLEGSNNGHQWTVMDRRENDYHLAAMNYSVHNYLIEASPPVRYRYLRIYQTGKNHRSYDSLRIGALEFMGTIFQDE